MTKKLYLINSINGKKINSSIHIEELMPYIEKASNENIQTVNYNLDLNNMPVALKEINDKADILFVVHDFNLWNNNNLNIDSHNFTNFMRSIWSNKNIFIFPTEMGPASLIKSQIKEVENISKIIVGNDAFRKLLIKVDPGLGIPTNKIKVINIPSFDFSPSSNTKLKKNINFKQTLVFTPGLLTPEKDYINLLEQFKILDKKYKNTIFMLALKSHPIIDTKKTWEIFDKIQDYIEENQMQNYIRCSLDKISDTEYINLMRCATVVVFPQDNSFDMYNGCMIDALAMGKAIVAPQTLFSDDLVKKTSILLYEYKNISSFYDACSVVIENEELRNILEEHNFEYGSNLSFDKIALTYVNQIKRFKFN